MTSSIRESLWLLPSALTSQPDLWLSWDAANKKPGLDERWQKDPSVLRAAYQVCDAIGKRQLGIARVMRGDIVALDLDKVVGTPRDLSTLVDWAHPIVAAALGHGYIEWSASGRGIHVLLRDVPEGWQRKTAHRRDDGSGWDWIIGDNLCHITLDVISDENSREMVPAATIIPILQRMLPKLAPAPRPVVTPPTTTAVIADAERLHRYGAEAMEQEIAELSATIEGGRNHALNKAAFALGQLSAGGCIADVNGLMDAVMAMGLAIGLPRGEVARTFDSGFVAGQNVPRGPVDRPERRPKLPPRRPPVAAVSPSVPTVSPSVPTVSPSVSPAAATPKAAARQFTSLIHAADLHQLPSTDWLIDRFIGRGVITQLYGKPGSGKSLTALDIALTMAQQHVVVYAPGEAPGELRDRIDAWCAHTQSPVGNLFIYPSPVNLRDHAEIGALADECRARNAAMLVIDPLAESLGVAGLDENTAVDMGVAIAALRTLMSHAGDPAMLLVHHAGWDDAHERGSSALRGACRVVVRAQADTDDNRITLRVDKANGGKPFEELYYGLVPCGSSVVMVPHHEAKPAADAPLSPTQMGVLKALMLQQYTDGATQASICDATGMSRQTVSKAVDRLLKRTMIRRENTILHIEPAGRIQVVDAEAAGGIRTTVMSSVDGRYNWRVAPPPERVEPQATYDPQPCPLPVASVSPDLSPVVSPDLSPGGGDKPSFCPLPSDVTVAVVSPATDGAMASDSALQCEPLVGVSPVSPPCPHDVPDPCPLSPALRGSVKTPQGTTPATATATADEPEYVVIAESDSQPPAELSDGDDLRWWLYTVSTPPPDGTPVSVVWVHPSVQHWAAGRILARDMTSTSIAYGCPLRGFDSVDDADAELARHGYVMLPGCPVWYGQ